MFIVVKCVTENGNSSNERILNKNYILEVSNVSIMNGELAGEPACEIKLTNGSSLRALGKAEIKEGALLITE